MLAAGLDGIERELDPGEPTTELNLHELTEEQRAELGIELLPGQPARRDPRAGARRRAARRARPGPGEDYVDYFVRIKQRRVQAEWHDQVSQWEVDRYLQLF